MSFHYLRSISYVKYLIKKTCIYLYKFLYKFNAVAKKEEQRRERREEKQKLCVLKIKIKNCVYRYAKFLHQ